MISEYDMEQQVLEDRWYSVSELMPVRWLCPIGYDTFYNRVGIISFREGSNSPLLNGSSDCWVILWRPGAPMPSPGLILHATKQYDAQAKALRMIWGYGDRQFSEEDYKRLTESEDTA